jgi:hypothetical protein
MVGGQSRQKVSETPSQQTNWVWRRVPVLPATHEVEMEDHSLRVAQVKVQDPS